MSNKHQDMETIFAAALQLSEPAARAAFLDERCGGDAELRRELDELLSAHGEIGNFLEQTHSVLGDLTITESCGTDIGPYRLLEEIGSGGMGAVFAAEQREPVRRRVALKIIKPGMDTADVMARFEAERQALAMMDHPNIARVFDAGATASGRPYFVMELVDGCAITEYCDRQRLGTRERLALFIDTCRAIQHAHQKGIIHRDIKPTNVLVREHEGQPQVKVIDFGVAKAINQQLTERTIYTQMAQVVGTPLYMSPEQAELSAVDIDTRSDIFSLGVLLYELLTGETPHGRDRMREASFDELRRIIQEDDPPRPSTKVSTLGVEAARVSQERSTDPQKLSQALKGDLDWIVLKALEKDRHRRYETANGFAMDVQRFLNDEPVLAMPPSARYRLLKFVKRNRVAVIASSLVALAICLGLVGTATGMIWALRESERARQAAERAEVKEQTTRGILDFMVSLYEEANPRRHLGEPMTVMEFLDVGAERIRELQDEPDTMATLQQTIGSLYVVLSEYEKAEPLLAAARAYREPRSGKTLQDELAFATVLSDLAGLHQWSDEAQAEELAREATEILKRRLGPSPELADSLNVLGNALQRQFKIPESIKVHEESLAIRRELWPPEHPRHGEVATALHNLGIAYYYDNDLQQAESYYQQAIEIEQAHVKPNDPVLATSKHVLSIIYANQSKFEQAERWQREAMEARSKAFGPDHDHVGLSCNWLGNILRGQRKIDEALPLLRRAVEIHTAVYDEQHDLVAWDRECLLRALVDLGRFDEARELHAVLMQTTGARDDGFANRRSLNNILGEITLAEGDLEAARKVFQETLEMEPARKAIDSSIAVAMLKLAALDVRNGGDYRRDDYDAAVNYLVEEKQWSEADPVLLKLQAELAEALFEQGDAAEATKLFEHVKQCHLASARQEHTDPFLIHAAAQFLLNCPDPSQRDDALALELAERAIARSEQGSYHDLATLAQAQFAAGDVQAARGSQQAAMAQLPDDSFWTDEFQSSLARYESADLQSESQ